MYSGKKYDREEIFELYNQKKKPQEIADQMGCCISTVRKVLRKVKKSSYSEFDMTAKEQFTHEWTEVTALVKKGLGIA